MTKTLAFTPLSSVLDASATPMPTDKKRYASKLNTWPSFTAWRAVFSVLAKGQHGSNNSDSLSATALEHARQHALARGIGAEGSTASGVPLATAVQPDLIEEYARGYGTSLVPVAAVVGGVMGNECLKLVSGKDAPLGGVLLFDGMGGTGGVVLALE